MRNVVAKLMDRVLCLQFTYDGQHKIVGHRSTWFAGHKYCYIYATLNAYRYVTGLQSGGESSDSRPYLNITHETPCPTLILAEII